MSSIIRFLVLTSFMFYSASAFAIYKCEVNGKTIYSDEKCSDGEVKSIDTTNSRISASTENEAAARSKREKAALRNLEDARKKEEVLEEKARQKRLRANEAVLKKCKGMALKAKWAEEDAAAATGKSIEKAKRSALRHREKFEAECGKR